MNKTLYEALNEIAYEDSCKRKQNARRLAKIRKLKQENRVLSARRTSRINEVFIKSQSNGWFVAISVLTIEIAELSEQIGKNSAKIQRLRTLISQNK